LALEAYELAVSRHIDVIVLISGDGDFVPLLQKIALIGPRTMVLGGNFDQVSSSGSIIQTRTSSALLEAATYPILLNDLADDPARANDPFVTGLFLGGKDEPASPEPAVQESAMPEPDPVCTGVVLSIKEGYGFIAPSDPTHKGNLFFHHSQIENTEFGRLTPGDRVTFVIDNSNIKGPSAIRVHLVETAKEEPR